MTHQPVPLKPQTLAGKLVWFRLRGRQFAQFKFCNTVSLGPYTIDFYCPKRKLAIELASHAHVRVSDLFENAKQRFLSSYGISTMRVTPHQVFSELDTVTQRIRRLLYTPCQQKIRLQPQKLHTAAS